MKFKNRIAAIASAVVLATAGAAYLNNQKVNAVETATTYTEYYTMPSVVRSHPYTSANNFADISKSERQDIRNHFSSLLMNGVLTLVWNNGKIEKVSPLQNGSYTQQIFLPITYTDRALDGSVLRESVKKHLYYTLVGGKDDHQVDEVNWDHKKGTDGWQPGLEDNGYTLTTRDIAYTKVVGPTINGITKVENRPFGVTITRTVKDGIEQTPAKLTKSSKSTRLLKKNAYVYNAKGKRIKHTKALKKGKRVTILGKKGKFVRIGKGRYIKKANI